MGGPLQRMSVTQSLERSAVTVMQKAEDGVAEG